jgi:hypothetical protein
MIGPLIMALIALSVILFPLTAIIHIMKSEFKGNDKLIWVIIILFMPIIGSILYFAIGKSKPKNKGF